jgi:hypothetical protein
LHKSKEVELYKLEEVKKYIVAIFLPQLHHLNQPDILQAYKLTPMKRSNNARDFSNWFLSNISPPRNSNELTPKVA